MMAYRGILKMHVNVSAYRKEMCIRDSPYGLPMAAAWLVWMIGGANHALKDFVFGYTYGRGIFGVPPSFSLFGAVSQLSLIHI